MAIGSFRGVEFRTNEHETTIGRRQPTYAIPFADNGARSVDLGRAPRVFQINCMVLGDDYRARRDALIEALEQPGPGVLVHPEHGRLLVTVDDRIAVRESTDMLRCAQFRFTAIEAADQQAQKPPPDTAGALRGSTSKGLVAVAQSFSDPTRGLPLRALVADFVSASHVAALGDILGDLQSVNGAVSTALAIPSGAASTIDAISQNATQLLATPARLFEAFQGAAVSIAQSLTRVVGPRGLEEDVTVLTPVETPVPRTVGGSTSFLYSAPLMASLGSNSATPSDIETPQRVLQRQGFYALRYGLRGAALLTLADAAIDARYDSAASARAVRDAIANALVDTADAEPEPDLAIADPLRDAAAKVIAHLTQVAGTLATIVAYQVPATLPVEVIAWTLYGDAERSEEVIARNDLPNPGAVQGLSLLEVATT